MLHRKYLTALVERALSIGSDGVFKAPVSDATAAAGAATLHKMAGVVTSEALTTAAGAAYTLTLTNNKIKSNDLVFVSVDNGTNTSAPLHVGAVTPADGSVAIEVWNHDAGALDGTIKVSFFVVKRA